MSYPFIAIVVIAIIGVAVFLMWWTANMGYPDNDLDEKFYEERTMRLLVFLVGFALGIVNIYVSSDWHARIGWIGTTILYLMLYLSIAIDS